MNRACRAGATSIEFAIVALAFVTLLLLAMETGWQMVIEAGLGAGGRAASRFGTTGTVVAPGLTPPPVSRDDSILQLVLLNSGGLLQATQLTISETSYASFSAIAGGGTGTPGPGGAGQPVQYTFTYKQPYLTPIAIAIAGQDFLLHTLTVTVLNEPFPTP